MRGCDYLEALRKCGEKGRARVKILESMQNEQRMPFAAAHDLELKVGNAYSPNRFGLRAIRHACSFATLAYP